ERPVYAADQHAGVQHAVVDVPAFGFVHLTPAVAAPRDKKELVLAEDGVLRNEFFEAIINPTTGSLAAIHEYKSRGNRLSQQLSLRMPGTKQRSEERRVGKARETMGADPASKENTSNTR